MSGRGSSDDSIDDTEVTDILPDEGSKKKSTSKRTPKRKQPSRAAREESSSDGDGMDEDLYYDAQDRKKLLEMGDVDREEILFERAEKRKDAMERRKISKQSQDKSGPKKSASRSANRDDPRSREPEPKASSSRSSALADINARRQKLKKPSYRNSDSEDYQDQPSGSERETSSFRDRYNDHVDVRREDISLNDLKPVILSRNKLEKWYGEPYFVKDIPGLFARITYGTTSLRTYRLVEILNVTESNKTYKLGQKECSHLLSIKIGGAIKEYEMSYVSNSAPSEPEFKQWLEGAIKVNDVPSKDNIAKLEQQIIHADTYVPTHQDIEEQVKKNLEKNPHANVSWALQRLRLQQQIEEERQNGNHARCEDLRRQLTEIKNKEEASTKKNKNSVKLATINQRNNAANKETTRRASALGFGKDDSSNSRRHTGSSTSWFSGQKQAEAVEPEDSALKKTARSNDTTEETPTKKMKLSVSNDPDLDIDVQLIGPGSSQNRQVGGLLKPIWTGNTSTDTTPKTVKKLSFGSYMQKLSEGS